MMMSREEPSHQHTDELAGLFEGCGGNGQENGLAACKLHLRHDAWCAGV
jgi:hypothetical protein